MQITHVMSARESVQTQVRIIIFIALLLSPNMPSIAGIENIQMPVKQRKPTGTMKIPMNIPPQ